MRNQAQLLAFPNMQKTQDSTIACGLPAQAKPETSTIKKLFRRVAQEVHPLHARVRFDTVVGKWAVLKEDNTPERHFDDGFMRDVTFSTATVSQRVARGCGPAGVEHIQIGIAEGGLVEGKSCGTAAGFHNMQFKGGFRDERGAPVERASVVVLLADRKAVFKP
jgi:hypothetical protein